jgi:predicted ATPase
LAFTQYCDILIAGKNSDWAKETVRKLQAALGQESCHLINVIPRLGNVLTPNPNFSEDLTRDQSSLHALQRLCYLMCQFVKVICETSTTSVCLWLDDLQWADKASYLVLNRLLLMDLKKFFFLTSIRDDEVPDGHPFHTMRNTVTSLGTTFSIVKLDCMTKDNLKVMLSNLLCLPPRLVKRLADLLYTKTKGNPLFCSQILLTLYRDGLLRLSLPRQRWVSFTSI